MYYVCMCMCAVYLFAIKSILCHLQLQQFAVVRAIDLQSRKSVLYRHCSIESTHVSLGNVLSISKQTASGRDGEERGSEKTFTSNK